MNRIVLVGRLTQAPELRYTHSGVAVAETRIAVRDPLRKDPDNPEREATDFFDLKLWNKTAEYGANYLDKGLVVAVHGRLCVDEFVGNDGQKKRKFYITVDQVENWGRTEPAAGRPANAYTPEGTAPAPRQQVNGPEARAAANEALNERARQKVAAAVGAGDVDPATGEVFNDPFADQ